MRACAACGSVEITERWACGACGYRPDDNRAVLSFITDPQGPNDGFDREVYEKLADIEATNFWFLARNELISWAAARYFREAKQVLEVGCGTGYVLSALRRALPKASLTGSEVTADGTEITATRVHDATLYQIDARHIPFRDHFDLIGAFDVLEHIDEDEVALKAIHGALTESGGLLLTVPQHPSLWSRQDELAGHRRRYTAPGLRRKLVLAGFEIVRSTSFVSLLLPAMFARQVMPRPTADAVEGLQIPAGLSAALNALMRVERTMIAKGVTFPVGGSLLVVARRRTEDRA